MVEALARRPWWSPASPLEIKLAQWNMWFGSNGQGFDFRILAQGASGKSSNRRIVNRLEKHGVVCTKTGLARLLAGLQRPTDSEPLPWVPQTLILSGGSQGASAYKSFEQCFAQNEASGKGCTWIVKPAYLNRGNGIEMFNTCTGVITHLQTRKPQTQWVVQKYIERPALVAGRKFDIRAYVLVTPEHKVFLAKEAYARTSSTPFRLDDLSDRAAHLTNDAVQKHTNNYNSFEDHCKMDLGALQEVLPGIDIRGRVWPAIQGCVAALFGAAVSQLNPRGLKLCWELLGLDFMIDEEGQVYLIEVNTSPALFRVGSYLSNLLPRVIEGCVQLAVDPHFPPPQGTDPCKIPAPMDVFEAVELPQAPPPGDSPPAQVPSGRGFASPRRRSSTSAVLCSDRPSPTRSSVPNMTPGHTLPGSGAPHVARHSSWRRQPSVTSKG